MPTETILAQEIAFDDEGFMTDHTQWSPELAHELAKTNGIDALTDRHFLVLDFMRQTFIETGSGPTIRRLTKQSGVPTKELYALFPGAPAKKAALIAGIKKPVGCI